MLRYGLITEVDPVKCYARVTFTDDGIVSDWLQILVRAAIVDKDSFTFEINEQVACLMDEHSEEGVILGAIFNDKTKPEGGGAGKFRMKFGDNSFIQYDRVAHKYDVNVQGDVTITSTGTTTVEAEMVSIAATTVEIEATSIDIAAPTITITGAVTVDGVLSASELSAPIIGGAGVSMEGGDLTADGEVKGATVKAGTVELSAHTHSGVTTGGGTSGPPIP